MNKYLLLGIGVIIGIVLTIVVGLIINSNTSSNDPDSFVWFDEPGEVVNEKEFRVMQVIAKDAALVMGEKSIEILAIVNDDGHYYYDHEKIVVPKEKVVRHIGIYHYPTKNDLYKTVRVIMIMDE